MDRNLVFGESITKWRFGGLTVDYRRYAPNLYMPRHAHEFSKFSFVVQGRGEELAAGRSSLAALGQVAFKRAGFEHADRVGPNGMSIVSLRWTLPTAWPTECAASTPSYGWCGGGTIVRRMRTLAAAVRNARVGDLQDVERVEAAALEVGVGLCAPAGDGGTWIEAAREFVHARFHQPISLGECARWLGRHPVSVARAFRRRYGCSVVAYAHRLRIEQAMHQLRDRDVRLADVALAIGYADQAHFCRFFRRMTGRTPGEHRRLNGACELAQ